eukprot:g2214.t1
MSRVCVWDFGSLVIPRTIHRRSIPRRVRYRSINDGTLGDTVPPKNSEKPTPNLESISTQTPGSKQLPKETSKSHMKSVRYSGLRGNPLSCGVESATGNFELPTPPAAARNLVWIRYSIGYTFGHTIRYPFGTLVDFVSDGSGFPVLRLSSLAVPTRNVLENPKCSVVVQMPGWSGLANARVTIFGDIYQLPMNLEEFAKQLFKERNSREDNILSGNSLYFRMHEIKDIFFVGGFGTVQWIDVHEYIDAQPDEIISSCSSADLQILNQQFRDDLRRLLSRKSPVHEVHVISIDAIGADIRTRTGGEYGVVRIGFQKKVKTIEEAKQAFQNILK